MKVFQLKPGFQDVVLGWGKKLMGEHKQEALESLREEQCSRELGFLFKIGGQWYMVGHMEGNNILPATDRPLNRKHQALLRECILCEVPLVEVYDLKV